MTQEHNTCLEIYATRWVDHGEARDTITKDHLNVKSASR